MVWLCRAVSRVRMCIACSWRESNRNWKHVMIDRDWVSGLKRIHTHSQPPTKHCGFGWYIKLASLCVALLCCVSSYTNKRNGHFVCRDVPQHITIQFSSLCKHLFLFLVAVAIAIAITARCWCKFVFLSFFTLSISFSIVRFIASIRFDCCFFTLFFPSFFPPSRTRSFGYNMYSFYYRSISHCVYNSVDSVSFHLFHSFTTACMVLECVRESFILQCVCVFFLFRSLALCAGSFDNVSETMEKLQHQQQRRANRERTT